MSEILNQKKIQRALQQPFKQVDLEWRVQSSGSHNGNPWARIIAYVTNRAIQQRLDDTVGIFGWKNEFLPLPNSVGNGALCGISVKFGSEWITKYDGADNTNIESTKGGLSGAMKRAGVQLGIGRYLYDIEAHYAQCVTEAQFKVMQRQDKDKYEKAKNKDNTYFYWKPPDLDDKYLPKKIVGKTIYDTIIELIEETETDKEEVKNNFGVDDLKDLYSDEAGSLLNMLLVKKKRLEEEKEDGTEKEN